MVLTFIIDRNDNDPSEAELFVEHKEWQFKSRAIEWRMNNPI